MTDSDRSVTSKGSSVMSEERKPLDSLERSESPIDKRSWAMLWAGFLSLKRNLTRLDRRVQGSLVIRDSFSSFFKKGWSLQNKTGAVCLKKSVSIWFRFQRRHLYDQNLVRASLEPAPLGWKQKTDPANYRSFRSWRERDNRKVGAWLLAFQAIHVQRSN